jgi:hypothetical protein
VWMFFSWNLYSFSHCFSFDSDFTPYDKDVMYNTLKMTYDQVQRQLPIFYTEYNDGIPYLLSF